MKSLFSCNVSTMFLSNTCNAFCYYLLSSVHPVIFKYMKERKGFSLDYNNKKNHIKFAKYLNNLVWFMVFNATFNNISIISWRFLIIYVKIEHRRNVLKVLKFIFRIQTTKIKHFYRITLVYWICDMS